MELVFWDKKFDKFKLSIKVGLEWKWKLSDCFELLWFQLQYISLVSTVLIVGDMGEISSGDSSSLDYSQDFIDEKLLLLGKSISILMTSNSSFFMTFHHQSVFDLNA